MVMYPGLLKFLYVLGSCLFIYFFRQIKLPFCLFTFFSVLKELEDSNRDREVLRQKCYELEMQVKLLTEDKSIITHEVENLQAQIKGKVNLESSYTGADSRIKDLKKQLEKGQEDIYKIEKERDEFSVKVEELEKTLEESTTRESELQILADQARKWKDEVDILRETADKVDKYEATIGKHKLRIIKP